MEPAELLAALFPSGHGVRLEDGLILGEGPLASGGRIHVIGLAGRAPLGIEQALQLSRRALEALQAGDGAPILLLLDCGSQRMSRRDELLGLNEYLAHLAKTLVCAELTGHRTAALLYGHAAAGAFVATGLAAGVLVALPGATPTVMDLPSMARVTKLPAEVLERMAEGTPVFAPGLDNLVKTGAVLEVWDANDRLDRCLSALLDAAPREDTRDRLGEERGGRSRAARIADRVMALASADV